MRRRRRRWAPEAVVSWRSLVLDPGADHLNVRVGVGAVLFAALLAGCVGPSTSTPEPANTIHVLAGSELKDLAPLIPDIEKATGVHLAMTYTGTLDGAERIVSGANSDLAWY